MSNDGFTIKTDKNSPTAESCANAAEGALNFVDLFQNKERLIGDNSKAVIPLALSTNKSLSDTMSKPLQLTGYSELLAGFSIQDSNSNVKQQASAKTTKPSDKNEILPQIILEQV